MIGSLEDILVDYLISGRILMRIFSENPKDSLEIFLKKYLEKLWEGSLVKFRDNFLKNSRRNPLLNFVSNPLESFRWGNPDKEFLVNSWKTF